MTAPIDLLKTIQRHALEDRQALSKTEVTVPLGALRFRHTISLELLDHLQRVELLAGQLINGYGGPDA
jgi:hypothetical protein